jgi:hypothetical protein
MEQEGQILMIGTQPDAKSSGWAKPRWIGAALICLTAVLCLGVGLGVAAARKQKPAHKTGASVAAKSAGKAKAASRRNGSLARAKAVALAKAKAGTRGRRGLTTASTMPPSPPARDYFGKQSGPAPLAARSIGSYVRGCLAGGKMLPVNGPAWQAMRLSRNRNWGHPLLVSYVEKLATDAQKLDNWPGLLVGDLAQPMGGPMVSGHASHQIGLDADIWLKPMPPKTLTNDERENISADSRHQSGGLAARPCPASEAGRVLSECCAHFRASRYQEGAVRSAGHGSRLAVEGAALVGASLSFPCAAVLPARRGELRGSAGGRRGRWLRQGGGKLAETAEDADHPEGSAGAEDADHHGATPGGMLQAGGL